MLKINQDNLCMKFTALKSNFSSSSPLSYVQRGLSTLASNRGTSQKLLARLAWKRRHSLTAYRNKY